MKKTLATLTLIAATTAQADVVSPGYVTYIHPESTYWALTFSGDPPATCGGPAENAMLIFADAPNPAQARQLLIASLAGQIPVTVHRFACSWGRTSLGGAAVSMPRIKAPDLGAME
jgi:hypothetical protein